MSQNQNRLIKLWQELKRRKVVKVIILYATTAFILLQVIDMIVDPLHLPDWVQTFFIILLLIGFPIALIFSWIFDVTPEGIEVTVASHKAKQQEQTSVNKKKSRVTNVIIGILIVIVGILVYPRVFNGKRSSQINPELEKSIAVLPFIDDSPEEGNSYIINGLMESILNNLSRVGDLKVISRTSVEKYRENLKLISEIGKELNVNYIVEGSGQKNGDEILLTVQLIDATNDKHLWSNQYIKNTADILNLQVEVAKSITDQIQVIISPAVRELITKEPTSNQVALDYYYRGKELVNKQTDNDQEFYATMEKALSYFKKAIEEDDGFASAYGEISLIYYYFHNAITYSETVLENISNKDSSYAQISEFYNSLRNRNEDFPSLININADKAMVNDSELDLSHIGKAHYYRSQDEIELATKFYKKALSYNPNSTIALNSLRFIYGRFDNLPDAEKFLEYTLMAVKLEVEDSTQRSSAFESLARAFRWAGFTKEAEQYIDGAISLDPSNVSAKDDKAHLMIHNRQYQEAFDYIIEYYDETQPLFSINLTLGLASYRMKDYEAAFKYIYPYIQSLERKGRLASSYAIRLAHIARELGKKELEEEYLEKSFEYANSLTSNYRYYYLFTYYSLTNNQSEAIHNLKELANTTGYAYWVIRNIQFGQIYDNLRDIPEFNNLLSEMEKKYSANQKRIKSELKEKGLL